MIVTASYDSDVVGESGDWCSVSWGMCSEKSGDMGKISGDTGGCGYIIGAEGM